MLLKARTIGLGLLVMLVAGAIASSTALAGPGPFWYHRENPGENGLKIQAASPEGIYGTGGPQTLKGTVATVNVKLVSPGVKITGFLYNNNLQGQLKLRLKFMPIKVTEPVELTATCQPEVFSQKGAHNVVFAEGHLAWKWNGLAKQLEEQKQAEQVPDIIFVPPGTQIQQGATTLPTGTFAEIKFPATGCGVLGGTTAPVTESTVGHLIQPENVNQFSNTLQIATGEGKQAQHFWNGSKFIGAEVGLVFGGNPSSFVGQDEVETLRQEVAIMEN